MKRNKNTVFRTRSDEVSDIDLERFPFPPYQSRTKMIVDRKWKDSNFITTTDEYGDNTKFQKSDNKDQVVEYAWKSKATEITINAAPMGNSKNKKGITIKKKNFSTNIPNILFLW